MSLEERENLDQRRDDIEMVSSEVSTPADMVITAITTRTTTTTTPSGTPLPPPSPRTVTTTDGISPLEEHIRPPPAYSRLRDVPVCSPPTYEECLDMNLPPPTYDSLFGRMKEAHKTSNGLLDYIKNLVILLMGTIGCTVVIGVTIIIPIFMIIMGSLKMKQCPAEPNIPIYLIVGGIFGVLKNLLSLNFPSSTDSGEEEVDRSEANVPWHRRIQFSGSIDVFLFVWFLMGCVWVYGIHKPSFDESVAKYCDYTLYQFAFWLLTSVYIVLGIFVSCMCGLSITSVLLSYYRPRTTTQQV